MNDERDPLEQLLAELPLAAPPDGLDARVQALGRRARIRRIRTRLACVATFAAAVVVGFVMTHNGADPIENDPGRTPVAKQPVSAGELQMVQYRTTELTPQGMLVDVQDVPYRVYRRRVLRTTWVADQELGYEAVQTIPEDDELVFVRAIVY